LCDQHPVEWVAVMEREPFQHGNMCQIYLDNFYACQGHELPEIIANSELTKTSLNGNFPDGDDANRTCFPILQQWKVPDGNVMVLIKGPNQNVRVKQIAPPRHLT
jgi:hypothetical protein